MAIELGRSEARSDGEAVKHLTIAVFGYRVEGWFFRFTSQLSFRYIPVRKKKKTMKRAIQYLVALTFAVVVACGFQGKPAHAQALCQVTSTTPCIVNLKSTPQNVRITTGQVVLAVYTNDDFTNPVRVTLSAGGQPQKPADLTPTQSVWQSYNFQNVNGITLEASSAVGTPNATVVLVQADAKQP